MAQDPDYDIESFRLDVATGKLDDYATEDPDPGHPSIRFTSSGDNARLTYLASILPGRILDVGRAPKKDIWLVLLASDQEPGTAVLFDWRTKSVIGSLHLRGSKMSDGDRHRLARTQLVRIPTRDGLRLDAFLTMPAGSDAISAAPRRPAPLVMYLHGGPSVEAHGRYDGIAQLLANRGYAVLQVNYRGSSGRGLAFEASAGQILAGTAIDDVIDSRNWAIAEGYAARGRISPLRRELRRFPRDFRCHPPASTGSLRRLLGRRLRPPGASGARPTVCQRSPVTDRIGLSLRKC